MLEKWMSNQTNLALLIIRLTLGIIFFAHGGQKLFGLFGGSGIQGTVEAFTNMEIMLPALTARLVAFIEFFGGIALILGFFTREASILIILVMLGAIWTVHWQNGFFITNDGFEYNFVLIGACLALLFSGGGAASIDSIVFPKAKWTFVKDPSKFKFEPPAD